MSPAEVKRPYGSFISIEGIDGCGRATQAKEFLIPFLEERGLRVRYVPMPTGSIIGQAIRCLNEGRVLPEEYMRRLSHVLSDIAENEPIRRSTFKAREINREYCSLIGGVLAKLWQQTSLSRIDMQVLALADMRLIMSEFVAPALACGEWVIVDHYDLFNLAEGLMGDMPIEKTYGWHVAVLWESHIGPDLTLYIDVDPNTAMERLKKARLPHDGIQLRSLGDEYARVVFHMCEHHFRKVAVVDGNKSKEAVFRDIQKHVVKLRLPRARRIRA